MSMSNIVANLFNWFKSVEKPSIELPNEEQEPEFNEIGKPVYVPTGYPTNTMPKLSGVIIGERAPNSKLFHFIVDSFISRFDPGYSHALDCMVRPNQKFITMASIKHLPHKVQLYYATYLGMVAGSMGYEVVITARRLCRGIGKYKISILAVSRNMTNKHKDYNLYQMLMMEMNRFDDAYVLQSSGNWKPIGVLAIIDRWTTTQSTTKDKYLVQKHNQLNNIKETNHD